MPWWRLRLEATVSVAKEHSRVHRYGLKEDVHQPSFETILNELGQQVQVGPAGPVRYGLGQEVQTEKPKLLRKALDSSDPAYAVAFLGRIGMDTAKVAKSEGLELVT